MAHDSMSGLLLSHAQHRLQRNPQPFMQLLYTTSPGLCLLHSCTINVIQSSIKSSLNQPINQPIKQSIDQAIDGSIHQSFSQAAYRSNTQFSAIISEQASHRCFHLLVRKVECVQSVFGWQACSMLTHAGAAAGEGGVDGLAVAAASRSTTATVVRHLQTKRQAVLLQGAPLAVLVPLLSLRSVCKDFHA